MGNSITGRAGRGLATAAALTCILAACGDGGTGQDDSASPEPADATTQTSPTDDDGSMETPPSEPPAETATDSASPQGQAALLRAGETALGAVANSTVFTLDEEDDGNRWEVTVATPDGEEHELDISADGRKILSGPRRDREDADDRADNRRRMQDAQLDFRAAAEAVGGVAQGTITELDLDSERGRTAWEAEVNGSDGAEHEVAIDAANGKVLTHETD